MKQAVSMALSGTVTYYNVDRGYGFAKRDDGEKPDVFVHVTELEKADLEAVERGDRIMFDIEESPKGPRAVGISIPAGGRADDGDLR